MALLLYTYCTLTNIIIVVIDAIDATIASGYRDATAARRGAFTAASGTDTSLNFTNTYLNYSRCASMATVAAFLYTL